MSTFKHHTAPVTTLEWHYSDSTVFASAGEDNQVCLHIIMECYALYTGYSFQLIQWDIAVEKDDITENEEVPPQLLFIHQVIVTFVTVSAKTSHVCTKI